MKPTRALAVAKADLRQLATSRDYVVPMAVMAIFFFVVMPLVVLRIVTTSKADGAVAKVGSLLESLPGPVEENLRGDTPAARVGFAAAVYLFAPIAVVVPLTIASAVGSNTIVGERERGTGEFLAHSPLTDTELYVGKLISSLLPGYLATLIGFGLYSLVVNLTVGPLQGGWFFPTAGWWLLITWVFPPFIAIAISLIVRISARVNSAAAAQQASSLVTLPVIVGSYAISSGLLSEPTRAAFVVGGLAWVVAIIGLVQGAKTMRREALLGIGLEARG